jgi:hypothetical protein
MWKLTGCLVVFALPLAAANAAGAAPAASPEATAQAKQWAGGVPAATGRLKFKSAGPVCMCAEGLSERDIEQALAKARTTNVERRESDASRSQAGGQEKTLNFGVAK